MDYERYTLVKHELQEYIARGVEELSWASDDIREDGVPQNWVDDIPNLTTAQRIDLAEQIPLVGVAQWATSLRQHLVT